MSGLYLQFIANNMNRLYPINDEMIKNAVQLKSDEIIRVSNNKLSGHVVHHGRLKSTGLNHFYNDRYTLVFNGACWLHDDSDDFAAPDDILKSLLATGFYDSVSLKGNYNFVFYDHDRDELIVESDLFGVYPLYYLMDPNGILYLSSEIKVLTGYSANKTCLPAVAEILKYGYIVTNLTLVEGIYRLMPNSRLVVKNGGLKIVDLKFPVFSRDTKVDDNVLDNLNTAFLKNINRYKNCTESLSISLSGGLDSRIAAFAANTCDFHLNTWCSGVKDSLECKIAKKVSDQLGADNFFYELDGSKLSNWFDEALWITEGRCHPGHMHFLEAVITGNYRPEFQLHGLIGDAVIGGDFDQLGDFTSESVVRDKCIASMQSFVYWPNDYLDRLLNNDLKQEIQNVNKRVSDFIFSRINFSGTYSDFLWFRYNYRVFGFTIPCLASQIIPWTDPIFPYLDNKFFEISSTLDLRELLDRKVQVRWVVDYFPGLTKIPRVKDGVLINMDNYNANDYENKIKKLMFKNKIKYYICRLSKGFINIQSKETYPFYDQWYRKWHHLKYFVDETLLSERVSDRGIWSTNVIRKLIKDLNIGKNVWNSLSSILLAELFIRLFIEGDNNFNNILNPSVFDSNKAI